MWKAFNAKCLHFTSTQTNYHLTIVPPSTSSHNCCQLPNLNLAKLPKVSSKSIKYAPRPFPCWLRSLPPPTPLDVSQFSTLPTYPLDHITFLSPLNTLTGLSYPNELSIPSSLNILRQHTKRTNKPKGESSKDHQPPSARRGRGRCAGF